MSEEDTDIIIPIKDINRQTPNNVETKKNKTADMNAYMREYMKTYVKKKKPGPRNKDQQRRYKNSKNIQQKYNIPDEIVDKCGIYLHNVITIYKLKKDMPQQMWDYFLENYHTFDFEI